MINDILLYVGSALIIIWGIAHIIPTGAIVRGFGAISEDNKKIITMESVAEGVTLGSLERLTWRCSPFGPPWCPRP